MTRSLPGNPYAAFIEADAANSSEVDLPMLVVAHELRTANLIAVATSPGDLRSRISEEQLTNIHDQILSNLGVGDNHGE